jgi:hypothetical protein
MQLLLFEDDVVVVAVVSLDVSTFVLLVKMTILLLQRE